MTKVVRNLLGGSEEPLFAEFNCIYSPLMSPNGFHWLFRAFERPKKYIAFHVSAYN